MEVLKVVYKLGSEASPTPNEEVSWGDLVILEGPHSQELLTIHGSDDGVMTR